jgi:hypothetical protein
VAFAIPSGTVLSIALTLGGMVAALWHMARIGSVLLLMVAISAGLVLLVLAHAQPPDQVEGAARVRQGRPQDRAHPQSEISDPS